MRKIAQPDLKALLLVPIGPDGHDRSPRTRHSHRPALGPEQASVPIGRQHRLGAPLSRAPQWSVERDRRVPAGRLFMSAVTVDEIRASIRIVHERDMAKVEEPISWLDLIVAGYSAPLMDAAAFREWACLKHGKSDALIEDGMTVASAKARKLTVATWDVRDFQVFGVDIPDPLDSGRDRTGEHMMKVSPILSRAMHRWRTPAITIPHRGYRPRPLSTYCSFGATNGNSRTALGSVVQSMRLPRC